MRVVHVITGLGTGGAETMLRRLVEVQRQEVVRVVSLMDVGPVGARIRALGVPVSPLGMRRGRPDPRALWRLVRLLRRDRPDVVQTWMYHADLLGGLAARALRIPVIWCVRHDRLTARDRLLTRLTRRACALLSRWIPARVVFNSQAARRTHAAAGYAPSKLVVVPNGFDLSRFHPDAGARRAVRRELDIPQDAPVVGLVARHHPHKDHRTFAIMAAAIRRRCPSARFVLCGSGIEWTNRELADLLDGGGLRPAVRLLGSRDDVERILASVDVACLTSRTESFPNAIAEAMACGVPCVSTACGDVREIVGETGRVVPVGDASALAEAVLEILRLAPEARDGMGAAARRRVGGSYAIEEVTRAFRDVQEEAAASAWRISPTLASGEPRIARPRGRG